jgi:phage portal protein BeeE
VRDVEVMPGDSERFIDYYEYTANGILYRLPAEYVVHFRLTNPFDIFRGLSPLVAAIMPADADNAMARWNGTFFGRDNVMPSAIINLSSGDANMAIDPFDVERLKSDLRSEYQASMRKTAITTANAVSAVLLGWNSKDMDFIAGRQFTKEEIYAIFGIPSGLLDKNATEANATVADQVFKEKTIWPLLCLLAEQITAQLVIPFYSIDHEAVFEDVRPVNRELELREVQAAGPYLTIDEVRQKYWRLDALPNGDGMQRAGQNATPGMLPFDFGAMRSDLRKWRDKAVKAVRNGNSADVLFESQFIPDDVAAHVREHLGQVTTLDEVKDIFAEAASLEVAAEPFCYP